MRSSTFGQFRHDTLTPGEFDRELTRLNMSELEFSKLTGVSERGIRRWLDREGDGPPYWVRLFLTLMASGKARQFAHKIAERHIMTEDEYQRAKEAAE